MKADQAIDTSPKRPEVDGKSDLADIELPPDSQKVSMEGQPGLGALLKQDAISVRVTLGQSESRTAAIASDAAASSKIAATVSSIGVTPEAVAQQRMTETGDVAIAIGKNKSDARQHVEIPMTPVYRPVVNPQVVRRDVLTPSTDRPAVKTTGQFGSTVAADLAPPSSPLPRESAKLQHALQMKAQPKLDADDGVELTLRTSRQETHLDNVRVAANGTLAEQIGKELQLQLQHAVPTQSADRGSSAEALRQPQSVDLQSSLSRPKQSEPLKTLTIQLRPDHLGTVTANLRMKGDVIHVELASAKSDVVQMIRQDRDIITEMLRSTGLMVSDDAVQVIELTQRTDANTNNHGNDRERFADASAADDQQSAFDQGGDRRSTKDAEAAMQADRTTDHDGRSDERSGIFI